ncbi:MAG: TonB-dependent receptor [Planctomycetes bacterium]|nr:TonB-dependent receptor [Planctomycetota bacterium]
MWLVLAALLLPQEERQEPVPPQETEVIIVGTRRESEARDVPSSVTVITREQIQTSGAASIIDVLQMSPGFFSQGQSQGAHDALADLRGYNNGAGNGQRTLVLVDGRRTNSPVSNATDWGAIALDNIERIEIVRGPAAALYGDPALAGVINIITRRGKRDTFRASLRGAEGSFDTWRIAVGADGGTRDALFNVFVSGEHTDGWRQNSDYDATNFAGQVEIDVASRWTLILKMGMHDDERRRPGTLTKAQMETLGRDGTATPDDFGERTEASFDAALVYTGDELGEFTIQSTALRGASEGFFNLSFGAFATDDEFEQAALYVKHVVSIAPWKLTTGMDLVYDQADATADFFGVTETDYRRRLAGAYEHVEVRPFEAMVLAGSLRWDRALLDVDRDAPPGVFSFDRTRAFDQFSPAFGVTYSVFEEVSLYGGYGRPFKYPTRDELNGFSAADPQLQPERSHSYEIGARLQAPGWVHASAGYYRMDVRDEIYFDPTTFTNLNFDEVRHQGVEGEFRLTPLAALELFGTYTYTRAVIRSAPLEGKKYPVTPAHLGTAGGTVRAGGAFLTLSGRVVGRRFLISDTLNEEERLASYGVMDAKLGYRWGKTLVALSVFNLLDREYEESGGVTAAGPAFNPGPERSFLVSFDTEF